MRTVTKIKCGFFFVLICMTTDLRQRRMAVFVDRVWDCGSVN